MRTTIDLPDDLLRHLKTRAAQEGRSLSDLVVDAARAFVLRESAKPYAVAPLLPISQVVGLGLQPGIDLDDSAALLDVMDGIGPA